MSRKAAAFVWLFISSLWCVVGASVLLAIPARPEWSPQSTTRPGEVPRQLPRAPARDVGPAAETGNAVLCGRVTDAETGQPVRRAEVHLGRRDAQAESRVTVTDDRGQYEIRDLAAGEYSVAVRKPGYADAAYGQRRPAELPKPLRLRDGERLEKIDIALLRGGVVTGRVVDEVGEPVLGAIVQVLRQSWVRGRRRMVPAGTAITNDLGAYRVFGLPPGQYFASARLERSADLDGNSYLPTYYPGTNDPSGALVVAVSAGQEAFADISLLPFKASRLNGIVLGSTGRPASGGRVNAMLRSESEESLGVTRNASVRSDGTFTINGLTPGNWVVTAWGDDRVGQVRQGAREFAQLTVGVGSGDAEGLTLVLSGGGTLRGRIAFQGRPGPDITRLRIVAVPDDPLDRPAWGMSGPISFGADGTFEVTGLTGRRVVSVGGVAQGWAVKSIMLGGQDLQDSGIDFLPGRVVSGIEILLSKDFATLSGQAVNDRGEPVKEYSVLVYSDEAERWFLPSGRWLKTVRADQDGLFKVANLSGGRYLVLAADSIDPSVLGDPEELERLRPYASTVTLTEREERTIQLKLTAF